MFRGKAYNEIAVGDEFGTAVTVTETHLVIGSGLFGDFNPLHVNETFAMGTRLGGRVLHGPFTAALVAAPVGNYFHSTAIAYLEHACRFLAPVRIGDTLTTRWTIREKLDKPKHNGGIAVMKGTCTNQEGVVVAEADGKILVASA
jgi:acyl dehydratase